MNGQCIIEEGLTSASRQPKRTKPVKEAPMHDESITLPSAKGIEIDPETGCWIWQRGRMGRYGSLYIAGKPGQPKHIYAHRYFYELFVGRIPPEMEIDHICHNTLCVNPDHLRLATSSQNKMWRKCQPGKATPYRGVRFKTDHNRFEARIKLSGRTYFLGYFADAIDAARAYDDAARRMFGEFAVLNFPEDE